jgi:glutaredoxin-like protein NrdH
MQTGFCFVSRNLTAIKGKYESCALLFTPKITVSSAKNAMDRKGIDYQLINLDSQPEAIDNLKSLGYRQVPVVMTQDDHWSGFRPDKIAGLHQLAAVGG